MSLSLGINSRLERPALILDPPGGSLPLPIAIGEVDHVRGALLEPKSNDINHLQIVPNLSKTRRSSQLVPGSPHPSTGFLKKSPRICSSANCSRPPKARGLCMNHYTRLRVTVGFGRDCSVPGCGRPHKAKTFCKYHYRQLDPAQREKERKRRSLRDRKYRQYPSAKARKKERDLIKEYRSPVCPPWADRKAIEVIYANRPPGHHVDHIIPLKGENVCGLHVPNNLQYLPAAENIKKSNSFKV